MVRNTTRMAALLLAVVALGCEENGPEGSADIEVRMRQSDIAPQQLAAAILASVSGAQVAIDPDTVASLEVRVTAVQALPAGGDDTDDGAWVDVDLDDAITIDLRDLPESGEAQLVASGTLPVGNYDNVRLLVDDAEITFTGPITLGAALDLLANVIYEVSIPSGAQTGIKTDASLTVSEDGGTVELTFRPTATFQNVTATGSGTVILTPVIRGS